MLKTEIIPLPPKYMDPTINLTRPTQGDCKLCFEDQASKPMIDQESGIITCTYQKIGTLIFFGLVVVLLITIAILIAEFKKDFNNQKFYG